MEYVKKPFPTTNIGWHWLPHLRYVITSESALIQMTTASVLRRISMSSSKGINAPCSLMPKSTEGKSISLFIVDILLSPPIDILYSSPLCRLFSQCVARLLDGLCSPSNMNIPEGVALTTGLKQNLFCIVVCVDALLPLMIVGPPGCSKTLSFSIAVDNMKSSTNQTQIFKKLHRLDPFRYQCTQHSTDTEIAAKYQQALDRQKAFTDTDAKMNQRCVVFLDEAGKEYPIVSTFLFKANLISLFSVTDYILLFILPTPGLPREEEASLKVIHDYLDHPQVPSIILSNNVLDAAKTNRALVLLHSRVR